MFIWAIFSIVYDTTLLFVGNLAAVVFRPVGALCMHALGLIKVL